MIGGLQRTQEMDPAFRDWLATRDLKPSSVSNRIADARRVEEHYGDLDDLRPGSTGWHAQRAS